MWFDRFKLAVLSSVVSVFAGGQVAFADSGSAILSCSGYVQLCESCSNEYFYIYSYQYAYVYEGKLQSESHSLSTSGFLGDADFYEVLKSYVTRHVLHSNGEYILAVPFQDDEDGTWVMRIGGDFDSENTVPDTWVQLCPR